MHIAIQDIVMERRKKTWWAEAGKVWLIEGLNALVLNELNNTNKTEKKDMNKSFQ